MGADKDFKVRFTGDRTALGAASNQAVQDLDKVKRSAEKLGQEIGREIGKGFRGLGLLIGNELRRAFEEGSKINTQAALSGVSSDFVRGSKAAFGRKGIEDVFDPALESVGRARAEALAGNSEAAAAFKQYGVDFAKPLEDVFRDLLVNIRQLKPGVDDYAPLETLFGGVAEKALYAAQNRVGLTLGSDASKLHFFAYRLFDFADKGMEYFFGRSFSGPSGTFFPMKTVEQNSASDRAQDERTARENKSKRELLSTSERLLAIEKERTRVADLLQETTDTQRWKKLKDEMTDLENEKRSVENRKATRTPKSFEIPTDEFAQRGLDIGGTRRVPTILEKSYTELQAITREVKESRRDNRDFFG